MADLAEIRAFLEAQGYKCSNSVDNPHLFSISIGTYYKDWVCFSPWSDDSTQEETCTAALNHFLSYWLGVRWQKVYPMLPFSMCSSFTKQRYQPFTKEEIETIEKAMAYYEVLEKEGQS